MFEPPSPPEALVYFGSVGEVKDLHAGQGFSQRLEAEITAHRGQIQAENYLLNTVAKYQKIAQDHGIAREDLNQIFQENKYDLDAVKEDLVQRYGLSEEAFKQPVDIEPVNTADFMRQRAAMMNSVLSSTPVLLRDPWDGKKVSPQYGFADFKAEVDGVRFSAIATPRYKGIPFRFAVMQHEHDGFVDNNPAMIMSNEFCDAFELYNKEKFAGQPVEQNPLIQSMVTNLKPNIHDRFHNWLLYDVNAASETFKQWGNDIYFVDHNDKNPLLINYEQVAACFHLYAYQTLFAKNPGLKDEMYDRLEHGIEEIRKFGEFLKQRHHPQAKEIEESTVYAVLSNIGFVLNPFEDRFQKILEPYPDVKEKLLKITKNGKGIGGALERLHGYEDGVPSLKYGGAKEATIEYILRYPLADEIKALLKAERSKGKPDDWEFVDGKRVYTTNLKAYEALPPPIKEQIHTMRDSNTLSQINDAIAKLPEDMQQDVIDRIEVSEEGYYFLRMKLDELDYTKFAEKSQKKKVLLIDIPDGQEVHFTNDKKLSVAGDKVRKQNFHLIGGKDVLAINVRDQDAADIILAHAKTSQGIDPKRAIEKARELSSSIGDRGTGDMYKILKNIAQSEELYGFKGSGFYEADLTKHLAKSSGPVVMKLPSGGDQRLVKGAFVYLPLGKDPASDQDPDCHLIENTDYKRDYADLRGTESLPPLNLKQDSPLMQHEGAQEHLDQFLQTLHQINFQITHGESKAKAIASHGGGLFS